MIEKYPLLDTILNTILLRKQCNYKLFNEIYRYYSLKERARKWKRKKFIRKYCIQFLFVILLNYKQKLFNNVQTCDVLNNITATLKKTSRSIVREFGYDFFLH